LKIPKGGNQNPYIEEEQTTQKKEYKTTTNDLQNIHIKLKPELNSGAPEGWTVPAQLVAPVVFVES
jgi:hypothetical protein